MKAIGLPGSWGEESRLFSETIVRLAILRTPFVVYPETSRTRFQIRPAEDRVPLVNSARRRSVPRGRHDTDREHENDQQPPVQTEKRPACDRLTGKVDQPKQHERHRKRESGEQGAAKRGLLSFNYG